MADVTVSNDIDAFMQSANAAAARVALGIGESANTDLSNVQLPEALDSLGLPPDPSTLAVGTPTLAASAETGNPLRMVVGDIPALWKSTASLGTGDGSLYIGSSATSIGNNAFSYCYGFTGSLTIPNSVTSIGIGAFEDCSGFTGALTIPNSVTTISDSAFLFCSGFTGALTIPNSVTTIGSYAFLFCSGFTGALTIPNSVTSIGIGAFENCSGFTGALTIPNSVTSISDSAFASCSGLTNVNCYVTRSIMNAPNCLLGTAVTTLHARVDDDTWTAGADTIGGKALTVIKDL